MGFLRKKGLFETGRVVELPVDIIVPNPNQPRQIFDQSGLDALAKSIAEQGILQPLTVRKSNGIYQLVAGERRLRAAQQLALETVPCLVVSVDIETSSLLALIENIQRRDLNFLEEAHALQQLIATFHLSQEEVAQRIGKSQSAVANQLRVLQLPDYVLEILQSEGYSSRHARALLKLKDPDQIEKAVRHLVQNRLTVAKLEAYIDQLLKPPAPKRRTRLLVKDVRFFLNTVTRGLSMMKNAGVDAQFGREESEKEICLTIRIPKTI